ncbi:hypothetical protein [Paenibacillus sp.]|uniref:hypothetical protein n=1 Tax=Paenibacillus sp. TaxID=58172 RepID=UPI00283A708C|nr:hypothetical protein [Paenibacillus sp.]MDR0271011.1 hypothetical protein [Paenibacillus sp.]
MEELMIKTGRAKKDITRALISLEDKIYIRWDNKRLTESIMILQGWEEPEKPIKSNKVNIDYWTQY